MKIAMEGQGVEFSDFADANRLLLSVEWIPEGRCFHARFKGVKRKDVPQDGFARGVFGEGSTALDAVLDYAGRLSNGWLVIDGLSGSRREFPCPSLIVGRRTQDAVVDAELRWKGEPGLSGYRPHSAPAEPPEPPHQGSSGSKAPLRQRDPAQYDTLLTSLTTARSAFEAALNACADAGMDIGVAVRPDRESPGRVSVSVPTFAPAAVTDVGRAELRADGRVGRTG